MTDVINLRNGNAYEIFEKYLTDLYWAQVDENGRCNYCMGDLLVVWGLAYDLDGVSECLPAGTFPTLFECIFEPDDDYGLLFSNSSDWWEGQEWAVVDAVYTIEELSYVPGKGFGGRAMKLLGRDDRREKE